MTWYQAFNKSYDAGGVITVGQYIVEDWKSPFICLYWLVYILNCFYTAHKCQNTSGLTSSAVYCYLIKLLKNL